MKRDFAIISIVVVTVAAMILAAVHFAHKGPGGNSASLGSMRGTAAPDFTLKSLDGKTVHLSDYRGKAVLLNFWATWCEPCKLEMPWFAELQRKYAGDGLQVVGVDMDEGTEDDVRKKVQDFAKKVGADYTLVIGTDSVADSYGGIQFFPATFYIDRSGNVVNRVFGLKGRREIEDNIRAALNSGGKTQTANAGR
jgi:thiol-disulfide isomerase/thioredoxin